LIKNLLSYFLGHDDDVNVYVCIYLIAYSNRVPKVPKLLLLDT